MHEHGVVNGGECPRGSIQGEKGHEVVQLATGHLAVVRAWYLLGEVG